jgi:hypothetical protein
MTPLHLVLQAAEKGAEACPALPEACATVSETSASMPSTPRAHGRLGSLGRLPSFRTQGSRFWMISLPSLPGEGPLTADPYNQVGAKLHCNEGTPPAKPAL